MASFNIIDVAGRSYKFVWKERRMLLHFGFWPIMLKIASFSLVGLLGYERNMLRQGLCLLPSYFLEGWLVAIAIRFAIFGEGRPEPLNPKTGGDAPSAVAARRAILGGTIIYMLMNLTVYFAAGMAVMAGQLPAPEQPAEPTAGAYFAFMLFTGFIIYMFRYVWLHVPVIMELPVGRFLHKIEGFNSSLYMLALWLACFLPVIAFLGALDQLLMGMTAGSAGGAIVYMQVMMFFRSFIEVVVAVLSGVAMAFAVRDIFTGANKKT